MLYTLPALLLALLALILALLGLSREPEQPAEQVGVSAPNVVEETPSYRYWIAEGPIESGEEIRQNQLRVVSADSPIDGAISAGQSVDGERVRRNLSAGELLSHRHLSAEPDSLSGKLAEGQRAIAIPVDNVTVAGGLLRPGNRVDVITAFRRSDKDAPVALTMLKGIPVLAVRGVMDAEASDDENNRRNETVVLSVPRDDVPALMLASSEGKLRLAVVGGEAPAAEQAPGDGAEPGVVAVTDDQSAADAEPFYFDDFFPEPPKATAPVRRASPGRRVQVFEGAETRSTYVR